MYFGVALFISKMGNVTVWYQKQFSNRDVTERQKLRLVTWPSLGGWGRYRLVSELLVQYWTCMGQRSKRSIEAPISTLSLHGPSST